MYKLERACRMQLHFQQAGAEWAEISDDTIRKTAEQGKRFSGKDGHRPVGTVEWDAFKRMLDRDDTSYRT
jgi:hypothetical protein